MPALDGTASASGSRDQGTVPVETYNVWSLQYGEYKRIWQDARRATRLRDKLGYVFGPPGWAPKTKV